MASSSRLRTLLLVLGISAVIVASLVLVFDLRVELAGSGWKPIFIFGDSATHFTELELNRSQHYSRLLPAGLPPAHSPISASTAEPMAEPADPVPRAEPEQAEPVSGQTSDAYWTDFRGPDRDGRYTQTRINTSWTDDGLRPIWKQPIGGGYASFVVADGRAFTIEQRWDQEVVAAYDATTGRELWTHVWDTHFREAMGGPGPRATPTWHEGRLYALGATGRFWCLDAETGAVIWNRNILDDSDASNLTWAMSGSPLIVDDQVVVQPGGLGWSVVAYDKQTGDVIWHALDDVQSYTSPMTVTLAGVRQILVVTARRVAGLTVEDGTLLWDHPWVVPTVPNISQPVLLGDDRVFLSASYGHGAAVIRLTRTSDTFSVETIWRNNRMKNRFSSSVELDGYLYGLDESILACVNAATGELMWKGGRYGYGQLLLAGDHLIVLTEDGDLALVRAIPEQHYEVARFEAITGKTWNMPTLADGRLFVRNAREMAAFDLREP